MPIEPFRKVPNDLREWSQFFRDAVVDANSALTATDATTAGTATTVSGVVGIAHGGTGASTAATARTALGLGTSATVDTGTSGTKVPLLDAANTWTLSQTMSKPPILPGYTVATLPAGTTGMRAHVTDAAAPVFLTAVVGGGAVVTPVFYNGAAWVAG